MRLDEFKRLTPTEQNAVPFKDRPLKIQIKGIFILSMILLFVVGFIVSLFTDNKPKANYVSDAKRIIEALRNPSSIENLESDFVKADTLFRTMSLLKDSTSDSFIMAKDELEALLTYKEQHIKTEYKKLRLKSLFSSWDNSCPTLERAIKKSMNDPDSYKHVETAYEIKGETIAVYCKYRGTNAFNAVVQGVAYGLIDFKGNLLEFKL